jgi:aspartyl-tRNA(Asn)/glutamyl-tRNA(Gln) amidotransferase subunit B
MVETGQSADAVMESLGIRRVGEEDLRELCRELLRANPKIVAEIKAGKTKAAGGLVGQAKKKNPNVNPARVQQICLELAQEL